jgi:hypothetical protein
MNTSFDWTSQRMELVDKLLVVLSGTIREWNTFISSDGDVGYFSDLDEYPRSSPEFCQSGHAGQSLRSIKQAFGRLENDLERLISLKESLTRDFTKVGCLITFPGMSVRSNTSLT